MAKHNSIFHVTQLDAYVDRGSFYFNPAVDNFEGALETLLVKALEQQVNLEGKVGLVVRVDPPGRWNPNNPYSREMGMDYDLAKDGLGTGLVYFPLLNAGDPIPSRVVQDPTTKDYSNVGWSRCGYVFVATREELDSLQVPHLSLFSNPPDRLYFVKKLNKPSPSLHVADDPCKKTQKVIEQKQKKRTLAARKDCRLSVRQKLYIEGLIPNRYNRSGRSPDEHRKKVIEAINKYLPKFQDLCDRRLFAFYIAQCAAESSFHTAYNLNFKGTTAGELDNTNRWREAGFIHLNTKINHLNFFNYLESNFPKVAEKVRPYPQNTWMHRNFREDVCYDLSAISSMWYFLNYKAVVTGPNGTRLNNGRPLTIASAVKKYLIEEKKDKEFVVGVVTSLVFSPRRWAPTAKWTVPYAKQFVQGGKQRFGRMRRRAGETDQQFARRVVAAKRGENPSNFEFRLKVLKSAYKYTVDETS